MTDNNEEWPKPDPTPFSMVVEATLLFAGMAFLFVYFVI